ncbi:hypothetical protein P4661_27470 [Priestia megaterium]|uniref:hypothetical protein n=1 Tax=Priestia megaterium TaxID=1404 RepID=UPI002E206CE0|nr:hypothetical protein [Priestia megaterium]
MLEQFSELLNRMQSISVMVFLIIVLFGSVVFGFKWFKNIIGMFILVAAVLMYYIAASL